MSAWTAKADLRDRRGLTGHAPFFAHAYTGQERAPDDERFQRMAETTWDAPPRAARLGGQG
jgi:hypothetical protein